MRDPMILRLSTSLRVRRRPLRSAPRRARSSFREPTRRRVLRMVMQRRNLERTYRLFTMIGYLLLGLSGITGSEQMVQPAFAASATVATMHPTTQHSATATPEDIVSQQIATPPEKAGGVKVSIANFTF